MVTVFVVVLFVVTVFVVMMLFLVTGFVVMVLFVVIVLNSFMSLFC